MVVTLARRIYKIFFNRKNKTLIKSDHASFHAEYGIGVLIDFDVNVEADVTIGDYSYVNKHSSIENCRIGKYCSISSGVYICPFEHPIQHVTTHPVGYTNSYPQREKVIIGNDVLISLNAIILSGCHIGDGAVIGAGAVVTKDVKPYEVVGGVPARHIKFRTTAENIKILEKKAWWDLTREELEKHKPWLSSDINNINRKFNE